MRVVDPSGPFGLSTAQIERYARHLILPEVGGRGQRALLDATVVLRGSGDAAEEAALFLAAAGVGQLYVEEGMHDRLAPRIHALNPDVAVSIARAEDADEGHRHTEADGASRLVGSMAALKTLVAIVGREVDGDWGHGLLARLAGAPGNATSAP